MCLPPAPDVVKILPLALEWTLSNSFTMVRQWCFGQHSNSYVLTEKHCICNYQKSSIFETPTFSSEMTNQSCLFIMREILLQGADKETPSLHLPSSPSLSALLCDTNFSCGYSGLKP